MDDYLTIFVEDLSDVYASRTYVVSGGDDTGIDPFDTREFDTKKEAVSFAREVRRAYKDAIAGGESPYDRVEILINGDQL